MMQRIVRSGFSSATKKSAAILTFHNRTECFSRGLQILADYAEIVQSDIVDKEIG